MQIPKQKRAREHFARSASLLIKRCISKRHLFMEKITELYSSSSIEFRNEVMKELKFIDFISLVILDLDSNRSFQEREMARNKDEMLRIINSRD